MDMDKIFYKILGENIFEQSFEHGRTSDFTIQEYIAHLNFWLDNKLKTIAGDEVEEKTNIIGPAKVIFDVERGPGWYISQDKLTVQSRNPFSTVKANCCIYGGKWMYEVQLRNKGVMQIGWCSNKCDFSADTGVGDTRFSYGYDGSKQQIWHVQTMKYGQKWQSGDIIGVCLDMDNEQIEYYRNGDSMGVAFSSIERGPGLVLYPAVSVAYNEGLTANFGNSPFRHPIRSYQPLQAKPVKELNKTELLLQYLVNLAGIISRQKYHKERNEKKHKDSKGSKKAVHLLVATSLVARLSNLLLNPYVIEEIFFPYVRNMCVLRSEADKDAVILPGSPESTLGTLLSLLWMFMEENEIKTMLKTFINMLLSMFRQTPKDLDYERQRKIIVILTCVCNHPQTRKFYLEHKFFKRNCLPLFLYLRPPEYSIMVKLFPDEIVWAEGIDGEKGKYLELCQRLGIAVHILYNLQKNLLQTLLENEDEKPGTPSSRKIFLSKLKKYVQDNSSEQRTFFLLQPNFNPPTESPIALSFLCILVDITKMFFEKELPNEQVYVEPKYFFDGTLSYRNFDRLGGVLSHLLKVFKNEIITELGDDSETFQNLENAEMAQQSSSDIYSTMFLISANLNTPLPVVRRTANFGNEHSVDAKVNSVAPGRLDTKKSLSELLDLTVVYYTAIAHKHVLKIAAIRDEIATLNDSIMETRKSLNNIDQGTSSDSEILNHLRRKMIIREHVFKKRLIELTRKQAWYRSVALNSSRRYLLIWLLEVVLVTLKKSSDMQQIFAFVPEIYINVLPVLLDSILDFGIYDVKLQYNLLDAENVIKVAGEFLGTHSADPRVILATCKDSLLQALGSLICHETGVKSLESASNESQTALIRALLRPYENRAWGQSNWLLLRFWLGEGFAYKESRPASIWQGGNKPFSLGLYRSRAKNETHTGLLHYISPACPSKHFQRLIGKFLVENEALATTFLNSVLSQLNWAFSEFILLLQEIQTLSNRQENEGSIEPRQLRICSMCFELTVSLMRSLEMILSIAPEISKDTSRQNSDLILNRVCQLVSQVLSRVTVPPGCFQRVVDMCLPDLSSVTHFAVISAALGILLALLREEMESDTKPAKISRLTRALLTDPSFQIANLEFALGELKSNIIHTSDIPRGNFDPKTRAHIDPLTNDIRISSPSSSKKIRADPPVIKFNLGDYPTHVMTTEINDVRKLIDMLKTKQSLLSDIILPSEDSLCPICCAKPVSVIFTPCNHQSCSNCILHHLMNSKVCFYCKALIQDVLSFDGGILYNNPDYITKPNVVETE